MPKRSDFFNFFIQQSFHFRNQKLNLATSEWGGGLNVVTQWFSDSVNTFDKWSVLYQANTAGLVCIFYILFTITNH